MKNKLKALALMLGAAGLATSAVHAQDKVKIGFITDMSSLYADVEGKMVNDSAAYLRSLAQLRGRNVEWADRAVHYIIVRCFFEKTERLRMARIGALLARPGMVMA